MQQHPENVREPGGLRPDADTPAERRHLGYGHIGAKRRLQYKCEDCTTPHEKLKKLEQTEQSLKANLSYARPE